jgi:RNA recognition motif-containing protein
LYNLFKKFGKILTCNILYGLLLFFIIFLCALLDSSGKSRCVGFVRMAQHSQALNAGYLFTYLI